MSNKKGFTLIEIITVLTILGLLATMAFVSYNTIIIQSATRSALNNLITIVAAEKNFYFKNGYYCDQGGTGCNAVNIFTSTSLNLNINDPNFSYSCSCNTGFGSGITCTSPYCQAKANATFLPHNLTLAETITNPLVLSGAVSCPNSNATGPGISCNPTCTAYSTRTLSYKKYCP